MSTAKGFIARILPFTWKRARGFPIAAPAAVPAPAPAQAAALDIPAPLPRPTRRPQLVRIDSRLPDGRIGVSVFDPAHPGFRYDFWCEDAIDALTWIRQLGEKSWVTRDHLHVLAMLILHELAPER